MLQSNGASHLPDEALTCTHVPKVTQLTKGKVEIQTQTIQLESARSHSALSSFFSFPSSYLEFLEVNTSERSPRTTEPILGTYNLCPGIQVSRLFSFSTCVCVCVCVCRGGWLGRARRVDRPLGGRWYENGVHLWRKASPPLLLGLSVPSPFCSGPESSAVDP